MADRVRTTHVGSLPRPPELVPHLLKREKGEPVDARELEAMIAAGVEATVKRQREIGIDIVNDGETSKLSYATYVYQRFGGISRAGQPEERPPTGDFRRFPVWGREMTARFAPSRAFLSAYECDGPLTVKDTALLAADLRHLRAAADAAGAAEIFMNAASPGIVAGFVPNRYYPTREAYLFALAEALRPEYEAITAAGFILQIDCPDLSNNSLTYSSDQERDAQKLQAIEAINAATAKIDPQRMRLHLCWGNYQGPHEHDLPLAAILPLICRARPAGISFEGGNPRHEHEWMFFDEFELPEDKFAIPGVIDNTSTFIEHPELVAQRISRYVRRLGADRVVAGVDCGFATHALTTYDPDLAFAKLRSLVEGAEIAAGRSYAG